LVRPINYVKKENVINEDSAQNIQQRCVRSEKVRTEEHPAKY